MQRRWLVRGSAFLVAALSVLTLLTTSLSTAAEIVDEEEGAPGWCPVMLPPVWGMYAMTGITFYVPKFGLAAGDEVPFTPQTYSLTTQIQPVQFGWGWYQVFPQQTQHENLTWYWQGYPHGPPGVLTTCSRTFHILFGWVTKVTWAGQIWGHAFPSEFPPNEETTTRGPTIIEGFECWELVAYGWDINGQYYEYVIDSWCTPVYAE
jgi:hypothetical protein